MKCLIAGASGLVGGELLSLLLADDRVQNVCAVGRRALDIKHPKLSQLVADFDSLDELQPPAADAAFCCLGTTLKKAGSRNEFRKVDHDYVLKFARFSQRGGVRSFLLVSAQGANPDSKIFYNRVKGETERDLSDLGLSSLLVFRPSLILGKRKEKRWSEGLAVSLSPLLKTLMIGPLAGQKPIEVRKIAEAMARRTFEESAGHRIITNAEMLG